MAASILSADYPWTLSGNDGADDVIRMAASGVQAFAEGSKQLSGFADTDRGRELRQRAVARMLGDFDKSMAPPRAFLVNAAKELDRLREYAIGFLLMKDPREPDALAQERERECRQHLAAQGDELLRGLHLMTKARQGDTRYLRAAWMQNPSVPLVTQETLDAALLDWMQTVLPTTHAKVKEITNERVLVEYATTEAERLISRHVGGPEQEAARRLSAA